MTPSTDRELKMECLKMAVQMSTPIKDYGSMLRESYSQKVSIEEVLKIAEKLYAFATTMVIPSSPDNPT